MGCVSPSQGYELRDTSQARNFKGVNLIGPVKTKTKTNKPEKTHHSAKVE